MIKPTITHLGHAGFMVGGAHGCLLMDPWFSPALLESWFPWPDNSHMRPYAYGNWLYVSHHHEDHFDEKFLSQLDLTEIDIIVPKFRSRRMERLWKRLGATRLHVLAHGQQLALSNQVTVTMLLDRSHKEDSALLLDHCGYRFLNMNDCELAISDIPEVDELAAQFSGAFWYPQCYDYERSVYIRKAAEVRQNNIDRLYRKFEVSGATTYRPSAGPAAFLDSSLFQYNSGKYYGDIFPQWRDVEGDFLRKFPFARIGEHLPVVESVDAYRERRQDDWNAFYERDNTPAKPREIMKYCQKLHHANRKLLQGYQKDIVFNSAHEEWRVRIGALESELEEDFDPSYWISMPRRVLRAVLNGDATWETALSSMRCDLHRYPDEYDFTLMSLLAYGDEPAITNEIARNREQPSFQRIIRNGWDIPRFCPHAGEDLTSATITPEGMLTCPRHGWSWDLSTGACVAGDKNVTLRTHGRVQP